MFKILDLASVASVPLDGRGSKKKLIGGSLGAHTIDVHVNTLAPGGAKGRLHKHSIADNVYIVRDGEGELIVEGERHTIRKDQIVFIPAGLRHSLSNLSDASFEIVEIYAPAGDQFDMIVCD